MTYFPDLTPYAYETRGGGDEDAGTLHVGWLAAEHAYPTGPVEERVVRALRVLAAAYLNQMRGFHFCPFCAADRPTVLGGPGLDTTVWLGSAEIRVTDADGTRYAAPNLVIHYITAHGYRPPEEFCRAAVAAAGA